MTRKELKLSAKAALKGKVFAVLLPMLIVGLITGFFSGINYVVTLYAGAGVKAVFSLIFLAISICIIPLNMGLSVFILNFAKGEKAEISDIFSGYKSGSLMGERIKAALLTGLYIFSGFICFIIPGIILAFKYSQIAFAFAENPELTYDEAMKRSADVMKGKKFDLFVLGLSFILWGILAVFTFGLLYIYLAPYMSVTFAKFYMDISGMNDTEQDQNADVNTQDYDETNGNGGVFEDIDDAANTQAEKYNDGNLEIEPPQEILQMMTRYFN